MVILEIDKANLYLFDMNNSIFKKKKKKPSVLTFDQVYLTFG